MAVIRCKMCGGDLNVTEETQVVTCEYCGAVQTVPTADNEKKLNLYNRANRLRFSNEFDKAAGVFESIVAEFPEEAEAYWGLCLCKYGIEYVDDPETGEKIPTCHRTSYEGIFDDNNFNMALEYADSVAHKLYREEAKKIDKLQQGILEIASKEEPFDIFICYKETDENDERTPDSVYAQEIYDALTKEGYKVFFSRITLEDKLGQEYEPYIFSALNSARIMLVIGTKYEYFNAVWVKNEWARFLELTKEDKEKVLIPCYKDIDAYDMPSEFRGLQGQDMNRLGFLQDLIRGIRKICSSDEEKEAEQKEVRTSRPEDATVKRGFLFLEDGDFERANEYFEKALDANPENSKAYLGKLLYSFRCSSVDELKNSDVSAEDIKESRDFEKALRFAQGKEYDEINGIYLGLKAERELGTLIKLAADADLKTLIKLKSEVEKYKIILDVSGIINELDRKIELMKTSASIADDGLKQLDEGNYKKAFEIFSECREEGSVKQIVGYMNKFTANQRCISAGSEHTVIIRPDGTVFAAGNNEYGQCDVSGWKDVVAVSAGEDYTLGINSDGKVLVTGKDTDGKCDVSAWANITDIAAGVSHTAGLKSDGTVVAAGSNYNYQCNVLGWKDIVSISAGKYHTVGLKSDGTVVAAGDNQQGQCNVSGWKNIIAVSAGSEHTIGLKSDGTVVAAGNNNFRQCSVSEWTGIIAVSAGTSHTAGLKTDGTVVAAGDKDSRHCNVSMLSNIVAVAAGSGHTVCINSSGCGVAVGDNTYGQRDISDEKIIDLFEHYKILEEHKKKLKAASEEQKKNDEADFLEEQGADIKNKEDAEKAMEYIKNEISRRKAQIDELGFALFGKKADEKKRLGEEIKELELQIEQIRKTSPASL